MSASTMDISPVQIILYITANYCNNLPTLPNITSFHPLHRSINTVTKLTALVPFAYPHSSVSFIFKIKMLAKLEKLWLDVRYTILFKLLFFLFLALL